MILGVNKYLINKTTPKMTKEQIVKEVAEQSGLSQAQAKKVVATTLDAMKKGIQEDGTLMLKGFGTFKAKETKARTGRNPKTGEPVEIAAGVKVSFKAAANFLESE